MSDLIQLGLFLAAAILVFLVYRKLLSMDQGPERNPMDTKKKKKTLANWSPEEQMSTQDPEGPRFYFTPDGKMMTVPPVPKNKNNDTND